MKSGTSAKLVLNMISTSVMIRLGRVKDNRMVDMKLSNDKLVDRGAKMVMEQVPGLTYDAAKALLLQHGSVRKAVESRWALAPKPTDRGDRRAGRAACPRV